MAQSNISGPLAIGGTQVLTTQGAAVADAAAATVAALSGGTPSAVLQVTTAVDASAGGTAQTTAIGTVPANSLILGVIATVTTPFDGDTTTTFEVGVTANPDQFIDTLDFDPSAAAGTDACNIGGTNNDDSVAIFSAAAVAVEALWTNTASATAGDISVTVFYITFAATDLDTQFDAIIADVADIRTQFNALISRLEAHGIIAS